MPYAELTIDQGATFDSTLDLVDDAGQPMNVAGYSFSGQIRKSYYSSTPTANLVITVSDEANGNLVISLSSAITTNIAAGRYVYDVKMTDTSNTVTRIVEGIVSVTPQVTK